MTKATKGLLIAAACGALMLVALVEVTTPGTLTGAISAPAKLREAVREDLIDPFSAKFRDIRKVEDDLWCGEVNSKNRMGGYVGWSAFSGQRVAGMWIVAIEGDGGGGNFPLNALCY